MLIRIKQLALPLLLYISVCVHLTNAADSQLPTIYSDFKGEWTFNRVVQPGGKNLEKMIGKHRRLFDGNECTIIRNDSSDIFTVTFERDNNHDVIVFSDKKKRIAPAKYLYIITKEKLLLSYTIHAGIPKDFDAGIQLEFIRLDVNEVQE